MTIEDGPEPEPDAEPHRDFEPDDLVTDEEDAGPDNVEDVLLISDEDAVTFRLSYERHEA